MKKIAFLFPGQGAQVIGMGFDFYENYSEAREVFEQADDVLSQKLSTLIFTGPEALLTETHNSQMAIYVVSAAILRVLQKACPQAVPYLTAGLSLGEYTAVMAAQRWDFLTGLELVKKRGELMSQACRENPGEMAVILGLSAEQVLAMVKDLNLPNDLFAANFNCPGQVVISGTSRGIARGAEEAKRLGAKRVLTLPVHGAFHSGLMQDAEHHFAPYLKEMTFKDSAIPVVMNQTGELAKDKTSILKALERQMTQSVLWEKGILAMEELGVDAYLEIGCGKALTNFNKRIGVKAPSYSLETVQELDALAKLF